MRLSRKLRIYLDAGPTAAPERVKKADVLTRLERGVWINVFGLGSTLLGLQVSVRSATQARLTSVSSICSQL